ncbi:MAG: hypothetical protein RIS86_602 [Planctomycetota bacterium]
MARRRPMRRKNGVSAYHMYVGQLLKRAKLKGKSKAARTAAMKKAVAQAMAMAKKGFPASLKAGVAAKNKKIAAEKAARRARRGGLKKAAYKALSASERRKVRRGSAGASAAPSRRRASSKKRVSAASTKKGTRMVRAKGGRIMYFVDGKIATKAAYEAAVGKSASRPASASKAASRKRRAASRKAASRKAAPKRSTKRASKKGARRVRKNPSVAGLLGTAKAFGREILTVQGIGGAAVVGVAHGFVAPVVAERLAEMFPQSFRVPVLDVEVSASSFAFTATGAVAGLGLAALGYFTGRPALGFGLGGLAFSSGLVIDTVGLVQSRGMSIEGGEDEMASLGDVAYGAIDNDGVVYGDVAYGDVAYGAIDNDGVVYGDVAYGGVMGEGGMDYGAACMSEYADAETADASDSGADFSEEEGQALMDGPRAWFRRFGRAPRRIMGVRGAKSRHAGRAGHRWGWLIKLVGMERAAKIAALPPAKRLKVIAALRQQAIDSLSTLMAQNTATTTEATVAAAGARVPPHLLLPQGPARPNLLPAPQAMGLDLMALGAGGAMGAGGYGSVVYAGSGF